MQRRDFLYGVTGLAAASVTLGGAAAAVPVKQHRIAIEEHFLIPEVIDEYRRIAATPSTNLDMENLGHYLHPNPMLASLLDFETTRLKTMDDAGIDRQVLSLATPGVQLFAPDRAVALAELANDRLAEVIARHPTRFGGLAAVAPQSPDRAVREMERAITTLKLNGFVIDSHTDNRYLDDPFFWPVLEAAQALDRPIYLHPRMPSDGMAAPFRGLALLTWAFGMEASTHAVRLIFSGVFDRFPKLQIVLGHMGEAVHFWQWRLDQLAGESYLPHFKRLQLKPSEYFRQNFLITTSGQLNTDALLYSLKTLGADHIIWAVDYPYEVSKDAVAFIENAPIDETTRAMIFSGNASRVLHLS
jgi:predicted TIM-barrel fold metal-dependent hydrolase